jgi:hypothetical protein
VAEHPLQQPGQLGYSLGEMVDGYALNERAAVGVA